MKYLAHYKSARHTFITQRAGKRRNRFMTLLLALAFLGAWLSPVAGALAGRSENIQDPVALGSLDGGHVLKPFKFIVATDSHLGSGQGNKNSALAFQDILKRHSDASFLIHMGDITETGATEEYELFKGQASKLSFPVLATMGNHEARWQDPQGAQFRNYLGPSTFSFDYGQWHFIVLNTSYPEQGHGTVDPAVLSWLEKDLASQSGNKPVAIFSHHPLLYQARNFQDADDAVLELIDKYPIQAVFSGHGHSFIPWKVQGRSFFMSGALMDNAYTLVEVSGKDLTVYAVKPSLESEQPSHVESLLGRVTAKAMDSLKNPIKEFSVEVQDGILKGTFSLSHAGSTWFQIDGGHYNELGEKGPGIHHEFSVDISAQAPGTHTLRLKVAGPDGLYIETSEFQKDTAKMVVWKKELGSALTGRLLMEEPYRVIAGTGNGRVYSIDTKSGGIMWEYDAGAPWGGGAIDDQRLYFGTSAGEIHCIDKNTGIIKWKTALDPQGFTEPPLVHGTSGRKLLYIGSSSGHLYAVNPVNGRKEWVYSASGAITNTPSAGLGMVFFGAWDQTFYALKAGTGQEVWAKKLGRQIYYSPSGNCLFDKNIVLTATPADNHSGGSFLYALDPYDGREVWKGINWRTFLEPSLPLYSQNKQAPAGRRYTLVPDSSGRITSYYTDNGEIPWHVQGYSSLFSGVPNLDGIYVTGGARGVLAIHAGSMQVDYKVRDTFLFVDPLVVRVSTAGTPGYPEYFVVQGDNKGTLWAIRIPISPR